MSNEKKSATLGMPHGTAANRLRKILLFDCLKRHSENICVRCLKFIETVDELSIEHLFPWEGISSDLFWNLKNIAYSHLICNKPNRLGHAGGRPKKIGPEGTAWCTKHQKFELIEKFGLKTNHWNGLDDLCLEARKEQRSIAQRLEYLPLKQRDEGSNPFRSTS